MDVFPPPSRFFRWWVHAACEQLPFRQDELFQFVAGRKFISKQGRPYWSGICIFHIEVRLNEIPRSAGVPGVVWEYPRVAVSDEIIYLRRVRRDGVVSPLLSSGSRFKCLDVVLGCELPPAKRQRSRPCAPVIELAD